MPNQFSQVTRDLEQWLDFEENGKNPTHSINPYLVKRAIKALYCLQTCINIDRDSYELMNEWLESLNNPAMKKAITGFFYGHILVQEKARKALEMADY